MLSKFPVQAVVAGLLTVAAAAAVSGQVLTAGVVGSQLQDGLELSCLTAQTCASLEQGEQELEFLKGACLRLRPPRLGSARSMTKSGAYECRHMNRPGSGSAVGVPTSDSAQTVCRNHIRSQPAPPLSCPAVAFGGYAFSVNGNQSQATCLCSNGTRVVARAAGALAQPVLLEGGWTSQAVPELTGSKPLRCFQQTVKSLWQEDACMSTRACSPA